MNYRHAYHAGNFADVLKHATLALIIEHLKQKPAPFRVIDIHAGAGRYDLSADAATRTGEWRDGIGRLLGDDAAATLADATPELAPYLAAVRTLNAGDDLLHYPGSPTLALSLMRANDRLIANELHPEDAATLQTHLGRDRRAKVTTLDAWVALKAQLPPPERRGVVLIDPPFEEAGELDRMRAGLQAAHRRFATGIYVLWFPIKNSAATQRFYTALPTTGFDRLLSVELQVRDAALAPDSKLSSCGLVIANPPFRIDDALQSILPVLAAKLATGGGAGFRLAWL